MPWLLHVVPRTTVRYRELPARVGTAMSMGCERNPVGAVARETVTQLPFHLTWRSTAWPRAGETLREIERFGVVVREKRSNPSLGCAEDVSFTSVYVDDAVRTAAAGDGRNWARNE